MAQIFQPPLAREFSNTGSVGVGYKYYFYTTGTTTPISTYTTPSLDIANPYPVVADSTGRFPAIWVSNLATTKVILKDASDNVIYTQDPVGNSGIITSLNDLDVRPNSYWGLTTGTSTAYILSANPSISAYNNTQSFTFQAHIANEDNPTIAISGFNALNLKKYTGQGTKVALQTGDLQATQRYSALCDGTDIVILNPEHPANLNATTTTFRGLTYLPSQITIANNASNPNTQIDFSGGVFQFSDGTGQAVVAAMTKSMTATWVAGNGNGGLDSGVKTNSTWYYCYAIYNPTTLVSDYIFSANNTTPTLPSGFTKYKRIKGGAIFINSSGNIKDCIWYPNGLCMYNSEVQDAYYVNNSNAGTNILVTVPFILCQALVRVQADNNATNAFPYIYASRKDNNGTIILKCMTASSGGSSLTGFIPIPSADGQVYIQWGGGAARSIYFSTLGFQDLTQDF